MKKKKCTCANNLPVHITKNDDGTEDIEIDYSKKKESSPVQNPKEVNK